MENFKVLMLGDVFSPPAVSYVSSHLWEERKKLGAGLVIVNGENSAAGNGIDRECAEALLSGGADVVTTGNHAFRKYSAGDLFDSVPYVLRPENLPDELPGTGVLVSRFGGYDVLVLNLLGTIFMDPAENPFYTAERVLAKYAGKFDFSFVDFHAETTSEKLAFAYAFAGRFTGIFGTHTHIATADERIIGGTAYITDTGMCGVRESVLGVEPSCIIKKLTGYAPVRFNPAEGDISAEGVFCEVDPVTKKAVSVRRIRF